ncbi:hypothetical protein LCGC14_0388450 [marine sediment metagenome]|uniref:Uncharacterized protein n=1 Tax=marine sediment metagenome TaxID=412755 RepID=A0A0F9W987_9ZZZZ
MIKRLYYFFKSYFEKKPEVKDPIIKVFSIEGVNYYKFKDISKVKCQRALTCNDFWNELSMRTTRDFLIKHTKAMETVLTDNTKIDIGKLFKLNQQLQERLEMIYETDIIYKIASVMFFTKDENILDYDDLLGREKIDLFKRQDREDERMGFFFGTLFKSIIGSTDMSDKDLATYMTVGSQITTEHLKTISTILSKKNAMSV